MTCRMLTTLSWHIFEFYTYINNSLYVRVFQIHLSKFWINLFQVIFILFLECRVGLFVVLVCNTKNELQFILIEHWFWVNFFCQFVNFAKWHSQNSCNIFYCSFCRKRSKCYNSTKLIFAIFFSTIISNFNPSVRWKVNIKVGHRNSFWVDKSFKKQTIFEWFNFCDANCISNNTSRTTTSTRTNFNIVIFRPMNKVPYNQKVFSEFHSID